jgi:hypothetical protein
MKNGKSPGLDRFTCEFYKFFWADISEYMFTRFFRESFKNEGIINDSERGLDIMFAKTRQSENIHEKLETYYSAKCR